MDWWLVLYKSDGAKQGIVNYHQNEDACWKAAELNAIRVSGDNVTGTWITLYGNNGWSDVSLVVCEPLPENTQYPTPPAECPDNLCVDVTELEANLDAALAKVTKLQDFLRAADLDCNGATISTDSTLFNARFKAPLSPLPPLPEKCK